MAEFFKQLIAQLSAIWQRLSLQQKIITSSLVAFTAFGLIGLLLWTRSSPSVSGYRALYSDLPVREAAVITEKLDESGYSYKLRDDGRTVMVEAKQLYEIRMALAREGLPESRGVGYEIFDKTNLAMTDFVQKINARRALEGELQRTIDGLEEVKAARVHIVVPEPTIFLDQQQDPTASVVLRARVGGKLSTDNVRAITHLVSASVEGLEPQHISVVDYDGRLLSDPMGGDETALASSRNLELQQKVERYLEKKSEQMLVGVLGPGKAFVKASVDLDFDRVERNLEKYDPESRVVRSEERIDETTNNAPTGDHQKERSLTNYEIDKVMESIVGEVGNVKRLTVSVAVDGKYESGEEGEEQYVARTAEEVQEIEEMVKNAVGYDVARGDRIVVSNMRFDNEYLRKQQEALKRREIRAFRLMIAKYIAAFILALVFIFFLRYLARTVAEAMNPPLPAVEPLGVPDEVPEEVPEDMKRSSEILERVEMLSREQPVNIATIIRQWLNEPPPSPGGK